MPAADWPVGYEMVVEADGVAYPVKDVKIKRSGRQVDRSNSKYEPGFEITVVGACKLTMTFNGPWVDGEAPLVIGGEYTWRYRPFGAHVGISFLGQLADLEDSNDTLDGPKMAGEVVTSGAFDLAMMG